jgi:hypothetical protein
MDWNPFAPKYATGTEPPVKPQKQSWQQRHNARQAELADRAGLITEADLRRAEASGATVTRYPGHVSVKREIPGGWRVENYLIEGNGRYRMPRR